jgi:hypothetical protein
MLIYRHLSKYNLIKICLNPYYLRSLRAFETTSFFNTKDKTMKQITFFLILSILFMPSCTRQDSPDDVFKDVPIVIDMDSVKSQYHVKFEYIRYVPLETTDECIFAYAEKVLIRDNKIYVADFSTASALFVFDMDGKFLFKIARKGQGPGEYISFCDFDIHKNGDIYMFDDHGKKFIVYSATGKYRQTIHPDYYFSNFCLVNNRMYWSELRERIIFVNLASYDIANKKTEFILKDKQFLYNTNVNASSYSFYYSPNDITYYSPKFSNIIYSLDENGIRPAIGFKNLNLPPEDVLDRWMSEKDSRKKMNMLLESEYFIENVYIYETDKYIMFKCIREPEKPFPLIYNKNTGKIRFFYYFFDDTGTSEARGSTGKEFFGVVNFNPDNEPHQEILKSREELKNWKEDDNPVIVFFNPDM